MTITTKSDKPDHPEVFWHLSSEQQLEKLAATRQGLTNEEANLRIKRYGANRLNNKKEAGNVQLFFAQFINSIILILLFATGLSFFLHDRLDAAIILTIVLISGCLGFWQEKGAANAVKNLLAMVQITVSVLRDGIATEIAGENLIRGDIILLKAGDIIPGDCLLLESDNLFVDEAILTGESYPAEKQPGILPADTPLSQRTNALWMGTHVQSGSATAVVIATGQTTEFGKLSQRIKLKAPETEFERGVRRFGYLLMEVTLILVILIFAVNVYLARPSLIRFCLHWRWPLA
ncbi:MAG: cation-transporting P-type ATPase [Methylococcaceae bacterium]